MRRPVDVLTGIFDIDYQAGQILQHDLRGKPGVATGAAGGDYQARAGPQCVGNRLKNLGRQFAARGIVLDGIGKRLRLLVNLTQHFVLENSGHHGQSYTR